MVLQETLETGFRIVTGDFSFISISLILLVNQAQIRDISSKNIKTMVVKMIQDRVIVNLFNFLLFCIKANMHRQMALCNI